MLLKIYMFSFEFILMGVEEKAWGGHATFFIPLPRRELGGHSTFFFNKFFLLDTFQKKKHWVVAQCVKHHQLFSCVYFGPPLVKEIMFVDIAAML